MQHICKRTFIENTLYFVAIYKALATCDLQRESLLNLSLRQRDLEFVQRDLEFAPCDPEFARRDLEMIFC